MFEKDAATWENDGWAMDLGLHYFQTPNKMEGQKLPNPKAEIGLKHMTAKNPQIPNRFELYWNAINLDFSHAETIQNQAWNLIVPINMALILVVNLPFLEKPIQYIPVVSGFLPYFCC